MRRLFVDCDRCLLDSRAHDLWLTLKEKYATTEEALDAYAKECPDDLVLNIALLLQILQFKANGYTIVLWTDRGERQIDVTMKNLSMWGIVKIFDMFIFGDGKKKQYPIGPDDYVMDDMWSNLEDVNNPIFIPAFG